MRSEVQMNMTETGPDTTGPWDDPRFETANRLLRDNRLADAIDLYDEILVNYPDHPRALHASGFLLHKTDRSGEAIARILRAISLKPDFALAHSSLGDVFLQIGQIPDALQCHAQSVNLAPENSQFYSRYLFCLECDVTATAEMRFRVARAFSRILFDARGPRNIFPNLIDPDKPLRIGLVSPDLGVHPVGMFLLPLLEYNNRDKCRFICYSTNERNEDFTKVLKDNSLAWREVSQLPDIELCDLIVHDRIDILIDLSGHTGQNRLPLFAHRAAPVQISWLGYSSTTAVPAMDYILTDATAVLPGEERFFTEKVIRFAPSRFCYQPVGGVPDVSPLPSSSRGYCTFGSFNHLAKLSIDVIDTWSSILKAVAGSRLVLKTRMFSDEFACSRYRDMFGRNGISSERIEFRPFSSHEDMLAEYGDIDIALDPFPFCGGMTTCNALWMGVPVVTLAGDRPIGRQTQGFLALAGLDELVAPTLDKYIELAVELASRRGRLSEIRVTLRERLASSPLCDPVSFTRRFEEAVRATWQTWCTNQHPKPGYPWDDPRFEEAYGLFLAAVNEGKIPEEAYLRYIALLEEYPDHPRALHSLGVTLHHQGESDDGIAHIRRAILLKPDYADAYLNLGNVYQEAKRFAEAVDCYRQFVILKPGIPSAYKDLARSLQCLGRRREALLECQKALDICPDYVDGLVTVGNILMASGESAKALEFTRTAHRLAPLDPTIHTNLLYTMNFFEEITQEEIFRKSRRWGKLHADSKLSRRPHLNAPNPDRKLRIGYVSGDFNFHPVSFHLKPVIEHHDRSRFEIYLYSTSNKSDDMTEVLKVQAEHFRLVATLPDERLEEMIRVDGIDILIDLSGHTAFHRLFLFAMKPAPVQVSWIGYFNTTGLKAIDYLISDEITIPPGEERWVSENVIRLPHGRFCYSPPSYAPEPAELPAARNGYITFGSFNRLCKISEQTLLLWCTVLRSVKDSRLILKTSTLSERCFAEQMVRRFGEQGIEAHRLDLRDDSEHFSMLNQYGDVDIALDTYPFNGGTTTCEALWMGVPVVTLSGATFISRQSASLLAACGMSEFVASTSEEFVSIATGLARNMTSLSHIRSAMRGRLASSPLLDGRLFTGNLESAYREIWRGWCGTRQGLPRRAYSEKTSFEEYYNAALERMDEEDDRSAVVLLKYALRKRPDSGKALCSLGMSYLNMGEGYYKQAIATLRKAISFDPHIGDAYKTLGRVLAETKKARFYHEATEAFEKAIELLPDDPESYYLLANLKLSYGHASDALELFRVTSQLAPDNPEFHNENIIFTMNYLPEYTQGDILAESQRWANRYGWHGPATDFNGARSGSKKLRIGYVSGDLHRHPVGIFFQAVAVNHDREFCEIFCYNNRKRQRIDEVCAVIRDNVEHWRDVKDLSDDELHAQIMADRIDILVDLSGYTDANRLKVFSRRAAPVQVSWLGYYNTTGIPAMDYVITDESTVPAGFEKWYSEKVVRMPVSRFCYTPSYVCPDVEPLAALQTGRITFGSFNNFSKLTEEVIEAWSQILARVPNSRIVLKWKNFTEKSIKNHYRLLFSLHGISSQRLEFRDVSPPFIMQDEYNDIDIALDPFPFTGGLTSCEALWMGVPVVTFAGDRPVSRQTAGFLHAIGLDELIAESLPEYVEKAVKLAGDISCLSQLKAGLRQKMAESPLCNGKAFASDLEAIYKTMVRIG